MASHHGNQADHVFGATGFTESDVQQALQLVFPPQVAVDLVAEWKQIEKHLGDEGQKPGVVLPDQVMLLLAMLSEKHANRVVVLAPYLEPTVRQLQAEPERWREIYDEYRHPD